MRDGWTPERRRADRRRVQAPLTATHHDTGARYAVVDLGRLGLVIETEQALPQDTPFACSFSDGAHSVGPVPGRVAHCRLLLGTAASPQRYLTGISFGTMGSSTRAELEALLARLAPAKQDFS
jgi:hypothetical protein